MSATPEMQKPTDGFAKTEKGNVAPNSQINIRLALSQLDIVLSHDVFADRLLWIEKESSPKLLDDAAMERLWLRIDTQFHFRATKDFFITVLRDAARQNPFHPVRDYLDNLEWDGSDQLDNWLVTYGGAEATDYVKAVGKLVLVAAVRRVRKPGAKFDEMLVLESEQGMDKSSALAALCPKLGWFSDDLPLSADSKEVIERTGGRWIIEAAELSGMQRRDVEHLKAFLSRSVDIARLSYDRVPSERPRHFIVIGTTNSDAYLRDTTGNRRFWPVKVPKFDLKKLVEDRDQLWAEASAREADGVSIRLDVSLWRKAQEQQEDRRVFDPWEEIIRAGSVVRTERL